MVHTPTADGVVCIRKVPLSEGSVEADGSLMCGYHGWRWNGDGKAICIPQARPQQLLTFGLEKGFGVLLMF